MSTILFTFASEIREKVSPRRIEAASNKQHYRAVMTSFWRVQRRRDASCNCNAAYERSKPLSNAEDNKNINNLNIGGLNMKINKRYMMQCRLYRELAHIIDKIPDGVVYGTIILLTIIAVLV